MSNPYTSLTLYRWKKNAPDYARLVPEANFVIDNIDDFISRNFDWAYGWAESQAFPRFPELETEIKLNVEPSPNAGLINATGNMPGYSYLVVEYNEAYQPTPEAVESNSSRVYYYFVTRVSRLSPNSVSLTIRMDTLNTFKPGLSGGISFEKETLVAREHRDRFVPAETTPGTWDGRTYRKIDDTDEGFSAPLFSFERKKLDESEAYLKQKCYLVYRASDELTPDNLENPLKCYLAYENGIPGTPSKTPSSTSVTMGGANVTEARTYFVPRWANPSLTRITFSCYNDGDEEKVSVDIDTAMYASCDGISISAGGYGAGGDYYSIDYVIITSYPVSILKTQRQQHILVAQSVPQPQPYAFEMDNCNYYLGAYTGFVTDEGFPSWLGSKRWPDDYRLGNGSGGVLFASMAQVNRYDSRNVKIVALPYSPVKWVDQGGYYDPPAGYDFDAANGLLSPGNLDGPFKREVVSDFEVSEAVSSEYPTTASAGNALLPRNDDFESKRYNSSFYALKFVYDSFSLPLMLEKCSFAISSAGVAVADLSIWYLQSSSISSKLAFSLVSEPSSFEGQLVATSNQHLGIAYYAPFDWPVSMVCARNNELPIFTSGYLDYIRYGYNYDLKEKNLAWASGWLSTGTGLAASAARTAIAGKWGTLPGAIAKGSGSIFGAIDSIGQTIIDGIQRDNALQKTLQAKSAGSVGVSGSDDLDLFEWTTGNKLWAIRSQPTAMTLKYILDYFHYFGYATNARKVPEIHTRANFNYLKCEPRFKEEQALGTDIAADLRERYIAGVTYLWENSGSWDFEGERANLELWAVTGIIN